MSDLSYEEEQQGLQDKADGIADINIDIPKDPEVDPEVYRDVEQLLFRGFLAKPAEINNVSFVFKSINHHEFEILRWMMGLHEKSHIQDRFYNTFLAYGVLMIDGINILPDRERLIPDLIGTFEALPAMSRAKVIYNLSEINRKAANAILLTEAYVMESYSRFKWGQLHGLDLMSTTVTGVPGSEKLGLNYGQLAWRALNHYEDMREKTEIDWEHAKFVGSCMAGKGLTKIYNQDRDRRKKDHEAKLKRKDALLRQVLLGIDPKTASRTDKAGATVIVANTVEELAQQLQRDLRGEKDWHDEVVAAAEAKSRAQVQERRTQLADMAAQRDRDAGGRTVFAGNRSLHGLSKEEVEQAIARQKQINAQKLASRIVHPQVEDPRMAEFLTKWGAYEDQGVQGNVSTTDRDPSEAVPVIAVPDKPVPFRRK